MAVSPIKPLLSLYGLLGPVINFLRRTSLMGSRTELFPNDDAFLFRLLYKSQTPKSATASPPLLPTNRAEKQLLQSPSAYSKFPYSSLTPHGTILVSALSFSCLYYYYKKYTYLFRDCTFTHHMGYN